MKNRYIVLAAVAALCLFACKSGKAPSEAGVAFEDLTIDQAVAKAEKENKLVLIDVFSPT